MGPGGDPNARALATLPAPVESTKRRAVPLDGLLATS
jgi:hypothetical protein